jgi:F-type H+-transporting ATPase subunit alpha
VPVEDIRRFEDEFLDHVQRTHPGVFDAIRETGDLSDDTVTALKDAIEDFRRGFETSAGHPLVTDEPVEPVDAAEVKQETVTRRPPPPPPKER